jgi:4-amino-4-deoxy-L-arabinose transferase-like glycosyltransferase
MSSPHASPQDRRRFWLLMLIALVVIGAGIGMRDPWPSDEPRFTLAAKQMVEGGDWLFPHRGSELYADKPPVLMWTEAASFELVRNWRLAFLLPSLLAALGTLALVYDLGRRLWNRQVGLYAAAGLLLAFQFVFQVKRAQIDPLVMFLITAGNWGLLKHMLCGPDWRAYWLGCFCAGLGVITKGVGFLPLLLLLPYAYAVRGGWEKAVPMGKGQALRWWLGLPAVLAAIALWLVPMLLAARAHADNPAYAAYVQDILFHQTADRYARSWGHIHSPLYYLPIVLFSWLPLSLTYPGTLPRWWRALRTRDARVLLTLGWSVLVLVFFSIPAGKRDVYILPVLPMVALASAPFMDELLRTRWLRTAGLAFMGLFGTLLLVAGAYALVAHPPAAAQWAAQRGFDGGARALFGWLAAIGAVQLALIAALRLRGAAWAVGGGMVALWLGWSFGIAPQLNDSSSASGLMARVRARLAPGDQIGLVAWKEQNLLMLDRPAVDFGFSRPWTRQYADAVAWQAEDPAHRWLFVQEPAMGACVRRDRAIDLGHANRREWWLFRADAVIPGCVPDPAAEAADARVPE